MGQQNIGGIKSFRASVALEPFRRVQLVSGYGDTVEYAGADEEFIGVTQDSAAADGQVAVALRGLGRTFKLEAAGVVVLGASIYGATNGRIDDTASGQKIGTALQAASGAGSIIECIFDALATSTIGGSVGLANRYTLIERFEQAPITNIDLAPTPGGDHPTAGELALLMRANRNFELLGTNFISALSVPAAGGGVLLTTAGADGNGMIILPHLDTAQSVWTSTLWPTDNELEWEALIRTGSAAQIGNCIIWAGLKTTNTDVVITDAEQLFFRYENGVTSGNWTVTSSDNGTDDTDDSGLAVAAATDYLLRLVVGADLVPKAYINGALVATLAALGTGHNLIPYIGVEADGAAEAKILYVRYQALSRTY